MMSVRDAAVQVLREAEQPLHAQKIAKLILAEKLWQTSGKTPAATVSALLYWDIKKKGDKSPFVLVSSQTFGLCEIGAKPKFKLPTKTYSFAEAAERVLEQSGDKKPMHFSEIIKKALEEGWLDTEGKTPHATMGA